MTYFSGFISLITLLALSSGPVYAEWVGISFTKSEGGFDVYANLDTVRRNGELVKMWIMYDYKTLQSATGLAHLSGLDTIGNQLHREIASEVSVYVAVRQHGRR